ncbi:nucleotidyltransferase domain-containing protein [Clostridium sp. A1-XYC3]|uniref:Nucleotidyltransferase domain-containing protein n=1 Tax=Clostridium tanneri TaxID=3037988 RepID=A0ABU4JWW8_9CLOT|nr:nucleotidyltransferase domain-containing protein [Clostridium sp. A1-XYC3]MDW8802645.1 nucleotidyltransferase domain-containing protein [Clostridium sp. A1-XYC3]
MGLNIDYLIKYLEINRIILFGSSLMGSHTDIDLLVVSDDFYDFSTFKRRSIVKRCILSRYNIDPICLTKKEYEKVLLENGDFIKSITNEGRIIYER